MITAKEALETTKRAVFEFLDEQVRAGARSRVGGISLDMTLVPPSVRADALSALQAQSFDAKLVNASDDTIQLEIKWNNP